MTRKQVIKLFEEKKVRTIWDDKEEKWYFSIVDVVGVLSNQPDAEHARNYWKVLKHRLVKEGNETVTNCNRLKMKAADGKMRLTDIITHEWSGMTTRQYKRHKGLRKENLRDNMTNLEMAFNILAEASATELSKQKDPRGFHQQKRVAKEGGSVAKVARKKLESQLGHTVISKYKASDFLPPIEEAKAKEMPKKE